MLPWTIVLALLGLILLFAEILMPGFGLFGILGGISLLAALVLTYRIYGLLAFLVMLALVVALFFVMIAIAKKSGLYHLHPFSSVDKIALRTNVEIFPAEICNAERPQCRLRQPCLP